MEFVEAANTPIPGVKVANNVYLLILRTGGMEKSYQQWEYRRVEKKTGSTSRIPLRKYTGATIHKKNQQPLPMDMELQETMHTK